MKSFILSIIIFAILLTLVITNSIYIHKVADKMISLATSLSPTDIDGVNTLCDIWQKHHLVFSISIHDSQIEKITELTENLKSAATIGNSTEFQKNVILLSDVLDELKKIEEISFHGII